ncbi:zinc finger protein 260-like [Ochlerotatus camptorhynchus]|uniref:zinc finger protein 260-like n=1 Tax=Ochlerotatus camptorhynchus TaxID=644619 RepID=UPI0031D36BC5
MSQLDVDKICRLCCEKKGRLRSLFEQRQEYPLSLRQMIFDVSRLEVDPEDRMPQKVCKWCITTLLKMHETIENYRTNDLKLRELLGATMLIEIKQEEEEVDMELLEKALKHNLEVDDICVKQEAMLEEYIDSERRRESEVTDKMDKTVITNLNPPNSEIEKETAIDKEDDEWKPIKEDSKDKVLPEKKSRLRAKTKHKKDANSKPKYGRRGKKDPNRPRLHDHKCYICKSESHGSAEALIAHLNSSHMDQMPYTCPECVMETVVIKTVQRLNAHKRQHLNPEKCRYCDKRYTDKNNLAFHVQMHHQNHCPSTCEHCGEVYPTKASLLYHMKLHTTAASCEICGKVFKERQKLRLHIQRRHEKIKKHECNICKKKLGSLDSVRTHIKTYHSNQVFKCSYCPKTFTAELTHRCHEKKHIENPDYVATKDWSEYYTIVEGEEGKPGIKMKKCNLCGLVCTTMSVHLSMVHFPTEYRCKICGATFKRKQTHDVHVSKHDNSNAYQCPICNREISDRKNLIAHLRTKQHRDHPLAQSLEWLGYNPAKARPRKPKEVIADTQQQAHIEVEAGIDDSL